MIAKLCLIIFCVVVAFLVANALILLTDDEIE